MSELSDRRSAGLFAGLFISAVGAVLLLRNFGLRLPSLGNYWPLLLMAFAVFKLWQTGMRSLGGYVLLAVGVLFLFWEMDILPFHPFKLWPLLLVGLGLRILRHPAGGPLAPSPTEANTSSVLKESAVFGGGERRIASDDFRGGRVDVAFGGLEIDLTASTIKESPAVLDVCTTFGGVDIRVPTTWAVTLQGSAVFGGCDDKTLHPAADSNPPQLIVNGYAVFGGCEVKN